MKKITERSTVTLHFSLRDEKNDEVLDSNFDKEPATFAFGDGSLLPGFEAAMLGLEVGDSREFNISPQDGFGAVNQENIHDFDLAQFSSGKKSEAVEVGLVYSFKDPGGGERPGVVTALTDKKVTIDFNHPLAGCDVVFKVNIVDVQNSPEVIAKN